MVADIHGNDVALRAVLKDASGLGVDRWWALGDLALFGPRPAEVLELLHGLDGLAMLRGNTDRYVLTGEQPAPHATIDDAVGRKDLVERYAAMAAGIGWTRGVLDQAGLLDVLTTLPAQLHLRLPGGTAVLGVHASPQADDGPGIAPDTPGGERPAPAAPSQRGVHLLRADRTAPDVTGRPVVTACSARSWGARCRAAAGR